nr:MAG TPA: hypothetical protein [Caudoviricetes sp.]DAZ07938.1 MAG TPA: hypothetical protein [Caudoviricetes sp.]DAZ09682.1 MAG TPA: hypothetical protein [Caudoviricetes sp.]
MCEMFLSSSKESSLIFSWILLHTATIVSSTLSFTLTLSPPYADSLLSESVANSIDFSYSFSYPCFTGHCHA